MAQGVWLTLGCLLLSHRAQGTQLSHKDGSAHAEKRTCRESGQAAPARESPASLLKFPLGWCVRSMSKAGRQVGTDPMKSSQVGMKLFTKSRTRLARAGCGCRFSRTRPQSASNMRFNQAKRAEAHAAASRRVALTNEVVGQRWSVRYDLLRPVEMRPRKQSRAKTHKDGWGDLQYSVEIARVAQIHERASPPCMSRRDQQA